MTRKSRGVLGRGGGGETRGKGRDELRSGGGRRRTRAECGGGGGGAVLAGRSG